MLLPLRLHIYVPIDGLPNPPPHTHTHTHTHKPWHTHTHTHTHTKQTTTTTNKSLSAHRNRTRVSMAAPGFSVCYPLSYRASYNVRCTSKTRVNCTRHLWTASCLPPPPAPTCPSPQPLALALFTPVINNQSHLPVLQMPTPASCKYRSTTIFLFLFLSARRGVHRSFSCRLFLCEMAVRAKQLNPFTAVVSLKNDQ